MMENGFKLSLERKMKSYSEESNLLANEIYRQAVLIAKRLGKYFLDNQISLVVPVNVASNPGNIALTLGLVLVTEILGIYVLNLTTIFIGRLVNHSQREIPGKSLVFEIISSEILRIKDFSHCLNCSTRGMEIDGCKSISMHASLGG